MLRLSTQAFIKFFSCKDECLFQERLYEGWLFTQMGLRAVQIQSKNERQLIARKEELESLRCLQKKVKNHFGSFSQVHSSENGIKFAIFLVQSLKKRKFIDIEMLES